MTQPGSPIQPDRPQQGLEILARLIVKKHLANAVEVAHHGGPDDDGFQGVADDVSGSHVLWELSGDSSVDEAELPEKYDLD